MLDNFPRTSSGYVVLPATSKLRPKDEAPVEVAWAAIVGVQATAQPLSLAQATLLQAKRVLRGDDQPEIGAAILLYLAQIGFSPAGRVDQLGRPVHVQWPPVEDGEIVQDRRKWRRPYLFALTSDDLYCRMLPAAEAAVLSDETAAGVVHGTQGARHAAALGKIPSVPTLRTQDKAIHGAVLWHTGAFAYVGEEQAWQPAVRREVAHLARTWATAPASHRLSDALASWIVGKANDGDVDALGTALGMLREGHDLTHAIIRRHQHLALEELRTCGAPRWEELVAGAVGVHELLYDPVGLFGFETWQFTARADGALHIWMPEAVNLGWQDLGRWAWLDRLLVAAARRDSAALQRQLDRLRRELALLGSHPEALLMREAPSTEDVWHNIDPKTAVGEPDEFEEGTTSVSPSDEGLVPGDSRRRRPDEPTEEALLARVKDVLQDRPDLWAAFYLVKCVGLSYREAARELGMKSASAVRARVEAAKALLQQNQSLRDWFS